MIAGPWDIENGPRSDPDMSKWSDDFANAWKMRWSFHGLSDDQYDAKWNNAVVSLSEDWWAAVWIDIVTEHSREGALKFWRPFAAHEALQYRQIAIGGISWVNWLNTGAILKIALAAGFLEREPDKFPSSENSDEILPAIKEHLGEWLYQMIQTRDSGEIRKLSDLVAGKQQPPRADMKGAEGLDVLNSFVSLLLEHYRLPSADEILKRATATRKCNNFGKCLKELGLSGLPESMPRLA